MPQRELRPLALIVALALLLGGTGLRWGLPGLDSWSNDAPAPRPPLEFGRIYLSEGHKYPNLQLGLDRLLYTPYLWWQRAKGGILPDCSPLRDCFRDEPAAMSTLITLSRLRSLAAFAGLVLGVHALALALGLDRRAALWAALWAALSGELAFFGKLDNLDLPYSFWLVWALVAWLKALASGKRRDDAVFGILCALAVTTKDQAFAAFILPGLTLLRQRWHEAGPFGGRALRAVSARFGVLLLSAGLPFVLINNLVFNWSGFVAHVAYFIADGGENEMLHGSWHPAVKVDLAMQYLAKIGRSMGWPALLLAVAGWTAWVGGRRPAPREVRTSTLLLWTSPFVSYYLFLILPLKVVDTRFAIPAVALLCIPAGDLAARLWRGGGWGAAAEAGSSPARGPGVVAGRLAVVGIAVYSFLYSLNMGLAMRADSRYAAEDHLRTLLRADTVVVGMDESRHLPRLETMGLGQVEIIDWDETVGEGGREALERVEAAEVIVISGKTADGLKGPAAGLRDRLLQGDAGHRLAWRSAARLPFGTWLPGAWVEQRVSPDIRILVREPAP